MERKREVTMKALQDTLPDHVTVVKVIAQCSNCAHFTSARETYGGTGYDYMRCRFGFDRLPTVADHEHGRGYCVAHKSVIADRPQSPQP
jgi:hypothetical protein